MNTRTSVPFQQWVGEVSYYLMREGGVTYGLFLQYARIQPAPRPLADKFAIASGVTEKGELCIKIHLPSVSHLPLNVASELLKLAILPLVFGQFGPRRRDLISRFGETVYNLASTLTVGQYLNLPLLESAGYELPTPADYDMDGYAQSTRWYCEALSEEDSTPGPKIVDKNEKLRLAYKHLPKVYVDKQAYNRSEANKQQSITPVKRESPDPVVSLAQTDHLPEESVDLYVKKEIEHIVEEAKDRKGSQNTGGSGRGWDSADTKEFFEQVKRKARMPWFYKLKQLETSSRKDVRVVSRMRPSRRHPNHFGRVKKSSLLVWFGVDTSGSMGKKELELVDAELKGIHNRGAEILVVHCDADVKASKIYNPHQGVGQFHGRGGTDFSPFLIALHEEPRNRPGFAVFYTDGYGCISGYQSYLRQLMTDEKYENYIEGKPTRTPQNIELMWLIPEGNRELKDFKRSVPIGNYALLPIEKGTNE